MKQTSIETGVAQALINKQESKLVYLKPKTVVKLPNTSMAVGAEHMHRVQ
jgi:hypothetical protein